MGTAKRSSICFHEIEKKSNFRNLYLHSNESTLVPPIFIKIKGGIFCLDTLYIHTFSDIHVYFIKAVAKPGQHLNQHNGAVLLYRIFFKR